MNNLLGSLIRPCQCLCGPKFIIKQWGNIVFIISPRVRSETHFVPNCTFLALKSILRKTVLSQWHMLSFTHILHPSIHRPPLIRGRVVGAVGQAGFSRPPSPQPHSPAPPGGSRGIPRPEEIYNPSSGFWVCLGVSSQSDVSGKPPKGGAREASWSDARTTSADSFRRRGAAALLRAPSGCLSSSP